MKKKTASHTARCGPGHRFEREGWIYLHVEGEPRERGIQHGCLLARELATILRSLEYLTYWNTGKRWPPQALQEPVPNA
jgi:hypothetical protein